VPGISGTRRAGAIIPLSVASAESYPITSANIE
jgi:hypothetical protein